MTIRQCVTLLTMAINVTCITDLCSLSGARDIHLLGWIITIQITAPEQFEILIVMTEPETEEGTVVNNVNHYNFSSLCVPVLFKYLLYGDTSLPGLKSWSFPLLWNFHQNIWMWFFGGLKTSLKGFKVGLQGW